MAIFTQYLILNLVLFVILAYYFNLCYKHIIKIIKYNNESIED